MSITLDQLARLYQAASDSNRHLAAAMRAKPRNRDLVEQLRQRSSNLNRAYDAARRQYKRQQKAERKKQLQTTMIRFYLDYATQQA